MLCCRALHLQNFRHVTEEEKNYQIPPPAKTLTVQDTHPIFYYMKEIPESYQRMSASYAQMFDMMLKTGMSHSVPSVMNLLC